MRTPRVGPWRPRLPQRCLQPSRCTDLHAALDPDDTIVPPSLEHLAIDALGTKEASDHADGVLEAVGGDQRDSNKAAPEDDVADYRLRVSLRAAQCRDAHSTIPLPSASLSAGNHQPRRLVVSPCAAASCREDDGRPVEVGCQEQTSNHPKRLASRVLVVSVGETSSMTRQVWIRKTNASEPLLTRREPVHDIETDGGWYRRDESGGWPEGCPGGVRRAGGVSLIQASLRNCGNQSSRCEGSRSRGDPTRT